MSDDLVRRNDLMRTQLENTLQTSSLADLIHERRMERGTFLLLDCSGSMAGSVDHKRDDFSYGPTPPGRRKIDALRVVVGNVREHVDCQLVGFGVNFGVGEVRMLNDRIPEPGGGTPLAEAISFAKARGAVRLVVISDGVPDNPQAALAEAAAFNGPIDVFYVGPRPHYGEQFMESLAAASRGGRYAPADLRAPAQLTGAIRALLAPAKK